MSCNGTDNGNGANDNSNAQEDFYYAEQYLDSGQYEDAIASYDSSINKWKASADSNNTGIKTAGERIETAELLLLLSDSSVSIHLQQGTAPPK